MAIFRPAGFVGAISGNLGGVYFTRGKAGPVIRQRNRRTRNTSPRATQIRAAFAFFRLHWRLLTPNQRTAWRIAAESVPFTNRLGLKSSLSGYHLFIKINTKGRVPAAGPIPQPLTNPPTLVTAPPFTFTNFSVSSAGGATVTAAEPIPSAYEEVRFYGARTFSTAPRASWYSFRDSGSQPLIAGDISIPRWNQDIGIPDEGEQCWVQIYQAFLGVFLAAPVTLSTFAVAP